MVILQLGVGGGKRNWGLRLQVHVKKTWTSLIWSYVGNDLELCRNPETALHVFMCRVQQHVGCYLMGWPLQLPWPLFDPWPVWTSNRFCSSFPSLLLYPAVFMHLGRAVSRMWWAHSWLKNCSRCHLILTRVVLGFDLNKMGSVLFSTACYVIVACVRVSMFVSALKEVKE